MRKGWNAARKINPVIPWPYFRDMVNDDLGLFQIEVGTLDGVQEWTSFRDIPMHSFNGR
jgi:hypothetical protein